MGAACCKGGQVTAEDAPVDASTPRQSSSFQVLGFPKDNGSTAKDTPGQGQSLVVVKSSSAVKVAVIVRPLLHSEAEHGATPIVNVQPPNRVLLAGRPAGPTVSHGNSAAAAAAVAASEFAFDRAYEGGTHAFHDMVTNVLDRFVQGFNGTVLAYGQTGSGKTFTMGTAVAAEALRKGSEPPGAAVIPRALRRLFAHISQASALYEVTVKMSFVEIYDERLQDLLAAGSYTAAATSAPPATPPSTPPPPPPLAAAAAPATPTGAAANTTPRSEAVRRASRADLASAASAGGGPTIRETPDGAIVMEGCAEVVVASLQQAAALLAAGSAARVTAAHRLNQESSRSHAVLVVTLEQRARQGAPVPRELRCLRSKLHLVDLAGCERAKETGATGQRFAEGVSINRGLLELGNVINALTEGTARRHIPYRNSKLTRLLQDSLGGTSETLFLACVSPASTNAEHTLSTLRYAARAARIRNSLTLHNSVSLDEEVAALRAQVAAMAAEVAELRSENAALQGAMRRMAHQM